jgi:hypothetical protein
MAIDRPYSYVCDLCDLRDDGYDTERDARRAEIVHLKSSYCEADKDERAEKLEEKHAELAELDAEAERDEASRWDDLYSRIQSAATGATMSGNGDRRRAMLDVLIMMDQSAGKDSDDA